MINPDDYDKWKLDNNEQDEDEEQYLIVYHGWDAELNRFIQSEHERVKDLDEALAIAKKADSVRHCERDYFSVMDIDNGQIVYSSDWAEGL